MIERYHKIFTRYHFNASLKQYPCYGHLQGVAVVPHAEKMTSMGWKYDQEPGVYLQVKSSVKFHENGKPNNHINIWEIACV